MSGDDRMRVLEAIIDSALDGIMVIDGEDSIELFNPAAERLFGYSAQEVLGENVEVLIPSAGVEQHGLRSEQYDQANVMKIVGIAREVTGVRRDGTIFPLNISVAETRVGGERHFTAIMHDLSARVALQQRLSEKTALSRIADMAAVIAHEINNPLTAVRGAIEVIGGRLPEEARDRQVVNDILARLDGVNELIKDLLVFARPPSVRPAALDIVALLHHAADSLSRDVAFRDVSVEIIGAAAPIRADADLLRIVFSNVFLNAAQAMQGTGTIRVSVSATDVGHAVAITDSGPGVSPEVRDKLFQPFVTTKARGAGLGLATSKRLVEAHAGTIRLDSPMDDGTTVTVELPSAALAD